MPLSVCIPNQFSYIKPHDEFDAKSNESSSSSDSESSAAEDDMPQQIIEMDKTTGKPCVYLKVKGFDSKFYVHSERCRFPEYVKDVVLDNRANLETRPGDVWITGYMKSGTNWLQEMTYMMLNECDTDKATAANLNQRTHYFERKPHTVTNADTNARRVMKTNLMFDMLPEKVQQNSKIIYAVRNPKDVIISYFHFAQILTFDSYKGNLSDFIKLFVQGHLPYGPWWDHVTGFVAAAARANNVLIVHYEKLLTQQDESLREIAKFLDVDLSQEKLELIKRWCAFENMKKNPMANKEWHKKMGEYNEKGCFMRKGEIGDWKNYGDIFDRICKQKFHGLTFDQYINMMLGENNPNVSYE